MINYPDQNLWLLHYRSIYVVPTRVCSFKHSFIELINPSKQCNMPFPETPLVSQSIVLLCFCISLSETCTLSFFYVCTLSQLTAWMKLYGGFLVSPMEPCSRMHVCFSIWMLMQMTSHLCLLVLSSLAASYQLGESTYLLLWVSPTTKCLLPLNIMHGVNRMIHGWWETQLS